MNKKAIDRITDSMLSRIPRVTARADDPRIVSGELLSEKQARAMLVADIRRMFAEWEREINQCVDDAFAEALRTFGEQALRKRA